MSVLSIPTQGVFDGNLENMSPPPTDSTDRFNSEPNMSVLSVPPIGPFDGNLENMPETKPDITDKTNSGDNLSGFSNGLSGNVPFTFSNGSGLLDEYEERLAIIEYDGAQTPAQAERISYLDAFVSVLVTLPCEDTEGDWLGYKITAAKKWLLDQGIVQPR